MGSASAVVASSAVQLRRARLAAGFSLRQLAELTAIPHQEIHRFEHGLAPTPMQLRLLAAALRVPVATITGARHV